MNAIPWTRHLATVLNALCRWRRRSLQRRALSRLDDRMLRDIGIDRRAAEAEAQRTFWQISARARTGADCPPPLRPAPPGHRSSRRRRGGRHRENAAPVSSPAA